MTHHLTVTREYTLLDDTSAGMNKHDVSRFLYDVSRFQITRNSRIQASHKDAYKTLIQLFTATAAASGVTMQFTYRRETDPHEFTEKSIQR